jgi:NADH dehydrogenase
MILVAGGTGVLGGAIVERLAAQGRAVRVLTRDPARAARFTGRVEVAAGDLRDPGSLRRACAGATHVVTTANAFMGRGAESVGSVDVQGNRNLIDAAGDAAVRRFVFTSALLPEEYRAVDYFRAKFETEEYLRRSGLTWTILRPTAFMETWAELLGGPLMREGATTIFGRGNLPTNFVAVENVAEVAALTLDDPSAENAVVDVIGPENLTQLQVVEIFERVTGRRGKRKHLPRPVLSALAAAARPFNPVFARQVKAGELMARTATPFDPAPMLARYPVRLITLEEWVRRRYPAAGRH